MSDPTKVLAVPGRRGLSLSLVSLEGGERSEAGYLHYDQAFDRGDEHTRARLRADFVALDRGAFQFRVEHKRRRKKGKLEATWRTLWPEWDPSDDALPPEEGAAKIAARQIDQAKLTLHEVRGEPGG